MEFPRTVPFWGNDRIHSRMLLRVIDRKTGAREDILLSSSMELSRGMPYSLASGRRAIDVQIRDWRARGTSRLLGKAIEYRLSPGVAQPGSAVIAEGAGSDFPATMTFNALFDVYIGDELIMREMNGTARATGLTSIPPRGDDVFAVNKPFEVAQYAMEAVECAGSAAALTSRQRRILRLGRALRLVPRSTYDSLMPRS